MTTVGPRIAPAVPPYAPSIEAALAGMMPRNAPVPPLALFRTFVRHAQLAGAMHGLGRFLLGRDLALGIRVRELVIHRVCARCGCEYEWGVHAASFAARAGLTPAQLAATVHGQPGDAVWSAEDTLVLRLVDELHDGATVSDDLWAALSASFSDEQKLELLLLTGWYHAIAYLANGVRVAPEDWAQRFPPR